MLQKIKAGRYRFTANNGDQFVVKNVTSAKWVVLNDSGRSIREFTTLGAASDWLSSLNYRPASKRSVKHLQDLLAEYKGTELAEKIRTYLNNEWSAGRGPRQADVSLAIRRLTAPNAPRNPVIPRQRRELGPTGRAAKAQALEIAHLARSGERR